MPPFTREAAFAKQMTEGERCDRRLWRMKGAERVAAGRKEAPPAAEASDRSGWADTCVCANIVRRKCLVSTRTKFCERIANKEFRAPQQELSQQNRD